jgi:uncharacterized membrane protein
MTNPFDPRSILLARHAQHVVLIHFPIALFVSGVALDLLSRGRVVSKFATAAYINLMIAALTVVPAAATGLLAWQFALDGRRLKGILLLHFAGGLASTVLILASSWIQRRSRKTTSEFLPGYRLAIELLGVAVLGLTAHLGGFLTGVNA